jgi:hemerythrin
MTIIQWENRFATGNQTVDQQHKELFELVNMVHEAIVAHKGTDVIMPTLDKLANYVEVHFKTEESLMTSSHYPNFPQHKLKHDELTRSAAEIIGNYKSGKLHLTMTLSQFLSNWLRHHIKEEDLAFINWLNANKAVRTY